MIAPSDCVMLMAGTGSRLSATSGALPKPLIQVAGRPLISYALDSLAAIGIARLHVVVGQKGERLAEEIQNLLAAHMELNIIANDQWQKQNGVSVLAAEGKVAAPFFLIMGDHIFERAILETLQKRSDPACLNLAIDRKISAIFDLDDAMKVQTKSDRVDQIGKTLENYDAIDTGLFLCPETIFGYLRRALQDGDCSLADGVRLMARDGKVMAIDIGAARWQDVDTPDMRAQAEATFGAPLSVRR